MKTHQRNVLKRTRQIASLLLIIISIPLFAYQEQSTTQGYISDELSIYMHAGSGTNYRILGTINAGAQIKLTGQSQNDYSQIIDENNKPKINMDDRWEYELRGLSYE